MAWRASLLAASVWALVTATVSSHGVLDRSSVSPASTTDPSGPRLEAGRADDASRPRATQHDRHQFNRVSASARSKREFQDVFVGDLDGGGRAEVPTEEAPKSLRGRKIFKSRAQRRSGHDVLEPRRVEMDGGAVFNGSGASKATGVAAVGERALGQEMDGQAWRRLNATGEAVAQAGENDDDDKLVGEFGSAGLLAFVVCFVLLFCILEVFKCFCCIEYRRRQRIRRRREELQGNDQGQRIPIALSRPVPPVPKEKDILVEIVIDGLPIITQLDKEETNGDVPSATGYAVADPSSALQQAVEQARRVLPRGSSLRLIHCAPAEPPEPDASSSSVES